jgi:hypothetical protein
LFVGDQKSVARMLQEENDRFLRKYERHRVFELAQSGWFDHSAARSRLLDCLKYWSDQFQRIVLTRAAYCESPKFRQLANTHLNEEFGHNDTFGTGRAPVWDPVLEATSEWFVSKMLAMDNPEKIVVVHLVLEGAATVAYPRLSPIMAQESSLKHFRLHLQPQEDESHERDAPESIDEAHVRIGLEILDDLSLKDYARLKRVLHQAWDMFFTLFDRIAALCEQEGPEKTNGESASAD